MSKGEERDKERERERGWEGKRVKECVLN